MQRALARADCLILRCPWRWPPPKATDVDVLPLMNRSFDRNILIVDRPGELK